MAVISVSIDDGMLEEVDRLRKAMGFAGRSELVRAGLRSFVDEGRQRGGMRGRRSAILLVVHADEFDGQVADIKHSYEDLIRAHLHNRIDGGRCVELFLLDGPAASIDGVTRGFLTNRRMDTVKLVVL